MKISLKRLALGIASAGLLTIYGCGGGGGSGSGGASTVITGTAATGAAISGGTVAATCQSGTGTATTNADGTYSLTITNGTLPCLLRVTTSTGATLYSAVEAGSTMANITPLTQLVIANALGGDPATAFATGISSTNATNFSSTALAAAVSNVQTSLTALGIDISTIDPLKATLVAATDANAGNAQDQQIDGLMAALTGANLKIGDLTTILATASSTSAASAAVTSFATTNSISSSTLGSCPVARTGKYVYAAPGDTQLSPVNLNFQAMSGTDLTNNSAISIAAVANTPCAYTFTLANNVAVSVRVSASGLAAFGVGSTFSGAAATALSTSPVGLVVPIQTLPTFADMAGTWYAMHFAQPVGSTIYKNFYTKFVIAANGTATAYGCTGLGVCDTTTSINTFTFTRGADNLLTARSTIDPTNTQLALYRSPNGDLVALGVNTTASATWQRNYVVFSNRVSPFLTRAVGSTYSTWQWSIKNSGSGLMQDSANKTFTVNSVDTANNSFTRTSNDTTPVVDTIFLNTPQTGIGMIRRPAVTTPVAVKDIVGFTGVGWTISSSTFPDATTPSVGANNFVNISIHVVN